MFITSLSYPYVEKKLIPGLEALPLGDFVSSFSLGPAFRRSFSGYCIRFGPEIQSYS